MPNSMSTTKNAPNAGKQKTVRNKGCNNGVHQSEMAWHEASALSNGNHHPRMYSSTQQIKGQLVGHLKPVEF